MEGSTLLTKNNSSARLGSLLSILFLSAGFFAAMFFWAPKVTSKVLQLIVRVELENQNFQVFSGYKEFNFDLDTKTYKLCLGELAGQVYQTNCEFNGATVSVLHRVGESIIPQKPACIFVNIKNNICYLQSEH